MHDSIISAKEARERVEELKAQGEIDYEKKVAEAIEEAINNRQCNCTIRGLLPASLNEYLKEQEYNPRKKITKDGTDTFISW